MYTSLYCLLLMYVIPGMYVKSYPLILILLIFIPIRSYTGKRYPGTVHTKSKREKLRSTLNLKHEVWHATAECNTHQRVDKQYKRPHVSNRFVHEEAS